MTEQKAEYGVNKQSPVALKKFQEETVGHVLAQVTKLQETGELVLPESYAPGNALKSAWLTLLETQTRDKRPVLDVCSKTSISNALLEMVVLGLSPMKKQCAFIAYGNKLTHQVQYQGNIALARRYGALDKIFSNVVYEGDVFEYGINQETGTMVVIKHEQKLENINPDKILGAYATYILTDGTKNVEIMNMAQIRKSWEQGATSGKSPAHKNFPDQMAKKTVINRAVKLLISSSDDAALVATNTDPVNSPDIVDTVAEEIVEEEIATKANAEEVVLDEPEDDPSPKINFDTGKLE